MRHRQQVDDDTRMRILKARELRREKEAAETFRGADAHVPRQRVSRIGDLLGGGLHGGFHRIDETEQALAFGGEQESTAPGLVEQQGAERILERAHALGDRRVIDAETFGGAARALRAGY